MDEINRDEGEKLDVSQRLTFERSPTARLEAQPAPDAMSLEMPMTKNLLKIDILMVEIHPVMSTAWNCSVEQFCKKIRMPGKWCNSASARP